MKKNIHPDNYRLVVFKDMSNGDTFITKSCAESRDSIKIDGVEYPLIKREISSSSHPFYTGKMKLVDTAGRVDKFYKKFGKSTLVSDESVSEESVSEQSVSEESVSEESEESVSEESVSAESASEESASEESGAVSEDSKGD